jgi:hypothetical protein
MSMNSIPDAVRDFVRTYIDSIAQLEALLLLRRETSEVWTTTAVSRRLYVDEKEAVAVLKKLRADGFVSVSKKIYRYECPPDVDALVGQVEDVYTRQLIPMTHLIHSKPGRIKAFADAFKLRKDS